MSYPYLGNKLKLINIKEDFPAPIAGVITLSGADYTVCNAINLGTDRIVLGSGATLNGLSPEVSSLTSTLGTGVALITIGTFSSEVRDITLSAVGAGAQVFELNGTANVTNFLSTNVRILDGKAGTFRNFGIVLFQNSIMSGVDDGFTVGGTITSFLMDTFGVFNIPSGGTGLLVESTTVVAVRIRVVLCSFVVNTGATGINFHTSATVPNEGYILINNVFSGVGTFLTGVQSSDNKAEFINNTGTGISNSRAIAFYSMSGNATATTIGATNTYVKVAGTTTFDSISERFTNDGGTSNRAKYIGSRNRTFSLSAVASLTSGNGNALRMAIFKNGVLVGNSEARGSISGTGDPLNIVTSTIVSVVTNDYLEVFVRNDTATTNITATNLIVTTQEV